MGIQLGVVVHFQRVKLILMTPQRTAGMLFLVVKQRAALLPFCRDQHLIRQPLQIFDQGLETAEAPRQFFNRRL